MKWSTRVVWAILAITLCLLFAAGISCVRGPAAKAAVLKIGFLVPLTGDGAPWGIPLKRGGEMAIEYANRHGGVKADGKDYLFKMVIDDDRMDPGEAVVLANKQIFEDKVWAIAGSATSACTIAILPITTENKIINFTYGESEALIGREYPYSFRHYSPAHELIPITYRLLATELNVKKVALLAPDYESGWDCQAWEAEAATANDIEVTDHDYYEMDATDFRKVLTRFIGKGVDGIGMDTAAPRAAAMIVKQARELGFKGLLYATTGLDLDVLKQVAGLEAMEGVIQEYPGAFDDPAMPEIVRWVYQEYAKRYHEEASLTAFLAWDSIMLFQRAINEAGTLNTDKVVKTIEGWETFETFTGPSKWGGKEFYGRNHNALQTGMISQVRNGKWVIIATGAP